jgi:phenylacetic acid degradation operon negative regulatory protein
VALLERPLGARSVMASLLLGMDPPRIRGALLVRWCGLFDIAEGTSRVALSRMVANGELTPAAGVYELAGSLRSRRREQEWSLAPRLAEWRGGWRMAAVDPAARTATERQALRDAMRHLRCAEVREGMWARPDNLPTDASPADARAIADAQCAWWTARPDDDPVVLADRLFAPETWSTRAHELVDQLVEVTRRLGAGDVGLEADAFLVGAAALVHVRGDPLLPGALLSADWPGDSLRDAYARYRAAFGDATATWFRRNRD